MLLVLFIANFSWIALSFAAAVVGFLHLLFGAPKQPPLPETLNARNAVVMPIYNEAPSRVFGALQAIHEDVAATGHGDHFDWFFLSDTTDPDVWIAEERAFIALRGRSARRPRLSTATAKKTLRARPGISPISSPAGARPTSTWWCSTPTA